jgi:hypothetical protein
MHEKGWANTTNASFWGSETVTTATTLLHGLMSNWDGFDEDKTHLTAGRHRGDVLDAAEVNARTGGCTKRRLRARAGGLRARRVDLDMKGGDTDLEAALGEVLGRKHRYLR